MTTKTLLMYTAAGLLTPSLLGAAADAGTITKSVIIQRAQEDTAPTANGRLRRTDSEQAGHEMPAFAMAGDGIHGYYYAMSTELPPTTAGGPVRKATHRVQLSMTPFTLQLKADGSGSVEAVAGIGSFITANDGDEYRNSHHPTAFALDATTQCVEYNYQENGGGDTKRYIQCFDSMTGANMLQQTLLFAKTNDDAATAQSSGGTTLASVNGGTYNLVSWRGANGNGRDDGWLQSYSLTKTGSTLSLTKNFDVSLAPREERTRGNCTVAAADPNTAICTWTEGNNQPARDGTWISAVDITPGKFTGADRQQSILWKEQIEGRKDIDGLRTYSMRASHERIMTVDANGALIPSDQLFFYSNDLRGNNNGNEKGGTVHRTMMGVIKADKAGMSYTMPLVDTATMLRGLGGTHLGMTMAMFGNADGFKPGIMFMNGSHTGGYFAGQGRAMVLDTATNTFSDGGMMATAEFDRHLYSNYLGNNPGNQGRNFHHGQTIANPFFNAGSTDKFITLIATTGKAMADMDPMYKTTAYLTVVPVASGCHGAGNGTGGGNGGMCNDGTAPVDPTDPTDPTNPDDPGSSDPGSSLGGCSTGGSATGFGAMFLGLAFLIRRRRSN